jgi:hypothetical protein
MPRDEGDAMQPVSQDRRYVEVSGRLVPEDTTPVPQRLVEIAVVIAVAGVLGVALSYVARALT